LTLQFGLQTEKITDGGGLGDRAAVDRGAWSHIAIGFPINRPLQQELGLEREDRVAIELDRLEIATDEEAVAVLVVDAEHPTVLHFLLLLNALGATHGDRQSLFHDQAIAPTLDQDVAIGLLGGHHIVGIDPSLGRCEGVIGEAHAIRTPAVRGDLHACRLDAPAADFSRD